MVSKLLNRNIFGFSKQCNYEKWKSRLSKEPSYESEYIHFDSIYDFLRICIWERLI